MNHPSYAAGPLAHAPAVLLGALSLAAVAFFAVNLVMAALAAPLSTRGTACLAGVFVLAGLPFLWPGMPSRVALAVFGACLAGFGAQSYTIHSLLLHGLTSAAGASLWLGAWSGQKRSALAPLTVLTACFCLIALGGAVLLPWKDFADSASLLGIPDTLLSAWFSQADSPWYALVSLNRLLLFALFASALSHQGSDGFRALFVGVVLGAVAACLFGLAAYFLGDGKHFSMLNRLTSFALNPGWFAELVCLSAPFLLTPLRSGTPRARVAAWLALAVMAASVILTMSRAGWLVFALVFAAILPPPHTRGGLRGVLARAGLGIVLFGLALGLVFASLGSSGVRFGGASPASEIQVRLANFLSTSRPAVFLSGALLGLESPLYGLGYETYAWLHPRLLAQPDSLVAKFGMHGGKIFETTHNLYIQLFAGGGVALVVTWLLLCWRIGSICLRTAVNAPLAAHTALCLGAFLLFGLFQEMLYIPSIWLFFFLCLARATALEREHGTRLPKKATVVAVALAASSILWHAAVLAGIAAPPLPGLETSRRDATRMVGGLFEVESLGGRLVRWSPGASSFWLPGPGPWEVSVDCPALLPGTPPAELEITTSGGGEALKAPCGGDGPRVVRLSGHGGEGMLVAIRSPLRFAPYALTVWDHRPLSFCVSVQGLTDTLPIKE